MPAGCQTPKVDVLSMHGRECFLLGPKQAGRYGLHGHTHSIDEPLKVPERQDLYQPRSDTMYGSLLSLLHACKLLGIKCKLPVTPNLQRLHNLGQQEL